jgi:8-oxo-dGTP pyrophosphatase MutT (NUDIX family)
MAGPTLRTDIVDVYVFRRSPASGIELLQMRRATGALVGTWHPVMGHVRDGESAVRTAARELTEETGFVPDELWQLEQPNIYYLASHDCIVLGPCFAVEVAADAEPVLNDEHDAHRWVSESRVETDFLWPGQRQAIAQILRDLLSDRSAARGWLRVGL